MLLHCVKKNRPVLGSFPTYSAWNPMENIPTDEKNAVFG